MRGKATWGAFLRNSKSPELPVVLLEDFGALIGLLFALTGVGLAHLTGDPRFDSLGSIAIGILLGALWGRVFVVNDFVSATVAVLVGLPLGDLLALAVEEQQGRALFRSLRVDRGGRGEGQCQGAGES